MPENSKTAADELRAVGEELRAAVNAQDLDQALSLLPRQRSCLQSALAACPDDSALLTDSIALLHSCLHIVQSQRQTAVDDYARSSAIPAFHSDELRGGTILLHG